MVDCFGCRMSGSEDEYEVQPQTGMTKAELRRSNKPIMEKRRRARINQSLEELKTLILEAMKKDPTRHSKLEKADILEMTVKHIQSVQRQRLNNAVASDPTVISKFRSGFSECAREVTRYVNQLENVDPVVKQRLLNHVSNCVNNLQQVPPYYSAPYPPSYMPERVSYPEIKVGYEYQNGDENNNSSARIQIPNGVQLIPSRLPSGELALLVPPSTGITANFSLYPPGSDNSRVSQPSAFLAVQRSHSPLLSPSTSMSSFEEGHHIEPSYSPNHRQRNFKVPEQNLALNKSYSPEAQEPQISSSSDRKSPMQLYAEQKVEINQASIKRDFEKLEPTMTPYPPMHCLRQPLSVITDKTYNRSSVNAKNESLKRHYSDQLSTVSEKRPKYQEPIHPVALTTSPVASVIRVKDEYVSKTGDYMEKAISDDKLPENTNAKLIIREGSSNANGDMWRPW